MSTYYECKVEVEGRGKVGVYADTEDEALEFASECDTSDIDIDYVQVTGAEIAKAEKV